MSLPGRAIPIDCGTVIGMPGTARGPVHASILRRCARSTTSQCGEQRPVTAPVVLTRDSDASARSLHHALASSVVSSVALDPGDSPPRLSDSIRERCREPIIELGPRLVRSAGTRLACRRSADRRFREPRRPLATRLIRHHRRPPASRPAHREPAGVVDQPGRCGRSGPSGEARAARFAVGARHRIGWPCPAAERAGGHVMTGHEG